MLFPGKEHMIQKSSWSCPGVQNIIKLKNKKKKTLIWGANGKLIHWLFESTNIQFKYIFLNFWNAEWEKQIFTWYTLKIENGMTLM